MTTAELLLDAFGRIRGVVQTTTSGLSEQALTFRLGRDANSIAWLVWHLSRIQDDHIADVAGTQQIWTADGWASRFGLPFSDADTGFGHSTQDVSAVGATSDALIGYHDAVHAATARYVGGLGSADLDAVVDSSWDPPVTLGVRLISVIADGLQHAGQAAFVRGLLN